MKGGLHTTDQVVTILVRASRLGWRLQKVMRFEITPCVLTARDSERAYAIRPYIYRLRRAKRSVPLRASDQGLRTDSAMAVRIGSGSPPWPK